MCAGLASAATAQLPLGALARLPVSLGCRQHDRHRRLGDCRAAARCSLFKALGQAAPVIVVGPPSCTMRQLKAAFWVPLQCPLPLPAQLATKKVALIRSQTSRRSSIPPLCPTSLQCGRVFRRATTSALRRRWRAPGKHPFASSGTGHLQIARYKGLSVCHRRYFLPRRRPGAQQHRSRPGADDF